MEIISSPPFYRSAFDENIFRISADESEIIELNIYDDTLMTVIGKKRLSGASQYDVDISNYLIRQFDVRPVEFNSTGFYKPQKRLIYSCIKSGSIERNACLAAGLETIKAGIKLSKAPDTVNITPTGKFEVTTFIDNIQWRADITLKNGGQSVVLPFGNSDHSFELVALCVDMADIDKRLGAGGHGKLTDYTQMTVRLYHDVISRSVEQTFNIVASDPDDIELCWWNHYGQVDFHIFRRLKTEKRSDKEAITTDDNYKVTHSESGNYANIVSEYSDELTLDWLTGILKSPAVWVRSGTGYIPVEVTTDRAITVSQDLLRLELAVYWKDKVNYRGL